MSIRTSTATARRFILEVHTEGNDEIIDLTRDLQCRLRDVDGEGVLHLFVVGSTAALTTLEFEPGLVNHDFRHMLEKIAPADGSYDHEATWNDDNGHSHLRASLIGPSLTIPFGEGRLILGQYQQIVLCEFDTRPRKRQVVCTVL